MKDAGFKVKAHRNLNAPGGRVEWSTTPLFGSHKGKVLGYGKWLLLEDVFFRVQPKGVQRIREKGVRSVVAWAEGILAGSAIERLRYPDHDYTLPKTIDMPSTDEWLQVRFDAFEGVAAFTLVASGEAISHAERVLLSPEGKCFAYAPKNAFPANKQPLNF